MIQDNEDTYVTAPRPRIRSEKIDEKTFKESLRLRRFS